MQQSAWGGFSAPYLSLLSSVRGRLLTQMWSCESTKMPPTCPSIQLFGSGFGQKGSGSNFGAVYAAAVRAKARTTAGMRESMRGLLAILYCDSAARGLLRQSEPGFCIPGL